MVLLTTHEVDVSDEGIKTRPSWNSDAPSLVSHSVVRIKRLDDRIQRISLCSKWRRDSTLIGPARRAHPRNLRPSSIDLK
jgi:hypothetical protein